MWHWSSLWTVLQSTRKMPFYENLPLMEICTELVQLGTYLRGGWARIKKRVESWFTYLRGGWAGIKKVCTELVHCGQQIWEVAMDKVNFVQSLLPIKRWALTSALCCKFEVGTDKKKMFEQRWAPIKKIVQSLCTYCNNKFEWCALIKKCWTVDAFL